MATQLFSETASRYELDLAPRSIETLQLNITRLCNQACRHCHVAASPSRTEMMTNDVIARCLHVVDSHPSIGTVDITGGAPELHPGFAALVERVRALGRRVMVRHNLTVTLDPHPVSGASLWHLPVFFARHKVEVVASLPCYTQVTTDGQRGLGVFEKSISSLRLLNEQGYGIPGSGLVLNLVSNPPGTGLPASQRSLEADFKRELGDRFGVRFNSLLAMTNMPIARFADELARGDGVDVYVSRLADAYNPAAAARVMCRSTISVAPGGTLFDCDFNQMLGLAIGETRPLTVYDFDEVALLAREIRFAEHCLGCAAGAGSSCGGATT